MRNSSSNSRADSLINNRNGSFHADLDVPVKCPIPQFCNGDDDLSSLSLSSLGSRGTQVVDLFPRSPIDLGFGSESEKPLTFKYHGPKSKKTSANASSFPLWRAEMAEDSIRPRSFLTQKQFVDYLRMGPPFDRNQLACDIRHLDFFFYLWLEENGLLGLQFFAPTQIVQDDKAFSKSWGSHQFQATSMTWSALSRQFPQLAIRFFYFRNNPEALMFAHIHLTLMTAGRDITQPHLPWLRDQYPGHN